jgi:adenylate kinase family enzyme
VLTDFPSTVGQAELLEEYKGGMNAFVHLTLPDEILVDIEESKCKCADCYRTYYKNDIVDEANGIRIEKFMPENNTCDDCGSQNFVVGSEPAVFEKQLETYKAQKNELLAFYNHFGLLVDFEVRHGYQDYEKIKRSIQFNLKH